MVNHGAFDYEYNLTDHLGNVRVTLNQAGTVIQKDDYYPFGLTFNHWNTGTENFYKLTGNEEQPEIPGVSDFNARFYDAGLGRFMNIDPLADYTQESWNPYHFNYDNPISYVDPTGLFSTHTDSTGNVIAVYDDGDLGVYRHDDATTEEDVDNKREESGTNSGNGEHMGETQFWDEFMDVDLDGNLTGDIVADARIDFGESWDKVIDEKHNKARKMSLGKVAAKSTRGGEFDLKAKHGSGTGKLLNGYYTTARSAGNYLAGLNAAGRGITFEKFMNIAGSLHRNGKYGAGLTSLMPHHNAYGGVFRGEHAYAGRMIMQGWFNNSNEVSSLTIYTLFRKMKREGKLEN
ncbi:MAG: RHS repeat-associated core domain-containing protein [Cyclobacteriaceae bacterium]